MEKQDYFLGLDMGTSSVGWAVTDTSYNLLRAKGKDMWGIREFEEAKTAVQRRVSRTSRRRLKRQKARIGYLKSLFDEAISEVDHNFYARLENSKFFENDKYEAVASKNGVFNDPGYADKEYYTEFPTIFHLRSELIHNPAEHDVRLVFLAILNMFKHRGHFLNEVLDENVDATNMQGSIDRFRMLIEDIFAVDLNNTVNSAAVNSVLGNNSISRSKKTEELMNLYADESFSKEIKSVLKEIFKGICGLRFNAAKVFEVEVEDGKKVEIDFSSSGYDESIDEILNLIGEKNGDLVEAMKEIHDIGVLSATLGQYAYLSDARIASYQKHKNDLRKLKKVIRKYCPEEYDRLFRSDEKATYSAYVKSYNSNSSISRRGAIDRKDENLYKTIKGILSKYKEDADVKEILDDIEIEAFLPKQLTSSNGVIPNQVHKKELVAILKNAESYLPFLKEKDETNLSVSEKIVALFEFRIPYYIGPTHVSGSKTGWAVRMEKGAVLPWNINKKIDIDTTKEKFIINLIRECTYISGAKVLPKSSLLYEKYCVLNEINNICVRNQKIDVQTKQEIFNECFSKGKKVTRKNIVEFLRTKDSTIVDENVTGIDRTINNSLANFGKFYGVLGEKMCQDTYRNIAEDIIKIGTIYGDDKKEFKNQLSKKYSNVLTEAELKKIAGFKFKDWGRMSLEFLEMQGCDTETGEIISLINAMWTTNYNMMELINSSDFTFKESLEKYKSTIDKELSEFEYEDLDEYYFSPPVKRMIWQTLKLIKEIVDIKGYAPKKIFVEMTRSDEEKGDKGRKASREKALLELYKNIKDETQDWKSLIESSATSGKLKSKKMYLYIKQMGRDMYTGETIDLNRLFDDNLYDIDHIYPRHFVKDDNIENNLALVNKPKNSHKSDVYPLDRSIRENPKVIALWNALKTNGLLGDEKYKRLTGNEPFTDAQKEDFIARQLVETSQANKGVADLIKQLIPGTNIVYSKASNVSEFRKKYGLLKCRSVNEFHHANDAYLNVVVGNVYDTKFTQNVRNFIKEYNQDSKKNHYNLDKMFEQNIERNGYTAWSVKDNKSIEVVKKVMSRNTPLMTRMNFERHDAISKATIYSADVATEGVYIPIKTNDERLRNVEKYGGYTAATITYFFLVEHDIKGKRVKTIEAVPLYKKNEIETGNGLEKYCLEDLKLINPVIKLKKIKIQSLIKYNGYYVYLGGKTLQRLVLYNATNLVLPNENVSYIKNVEKFVSGGGNCEDMSYEANQKYYDILCKKHNNTIFNNRPNSLSKVLFEGKGQFEKLDLLEQCKCILEILKGTNIGSISGIDLKSIGGASKSGVMLMSKNITDAKEFKLIEQSITGLYEKEIDLLSL